MWRAAFLQRIAYSSAGLALMCAAAFPQTNCRLVSKNRIDEKGCRSLSEPFSCLTGLSSCEQLPFLKKGCSLFVKASFWCEKLRLLKQNGLLLSRQCIDVSSYPSLRGPVSFLAEGLVCLKKMYWSERLPFLKELLSPGARAPTGWFP